MCNDYHADLAQMRGTADMAGGNVAGGGGIPDEIKQQILSMLPPAMVAQVSAIPGGIDSLLAQVISQNPALAAMMSGLSGAADSAASEQASEQSPLAGLGSLVSSLKSQMGDLPDDATPDQKSAFYLSIARWLGEQAHVSGSIVSTMFDKFEATFKDGLSPAAINGLVARGRGLLAVAGVPKRDTAHVIVRRLVSFIDKMQAETQGSTLTRATVASKVTSLARIACESEGGLEGTYFVWRADTHTNAGYRRTIRSGDAERFPEEADWRPHRHADCRDHKRPVRQGRGRPCVHLDARWRHAVV